MPGDDLISVRGAEVARLLGKIRQYREEVGASMAGYEVVVTGISQSGADVQAYHASGATWWLETLHGMRFTFEELMARVVVGPPR